jgi:hypothetical protein
MHAPLTVLNIRCPSVVYVNSPLHSFMHTVTADEHFIFKAVRRAFNINYWWKPYAYNCERGR